MMSSAFTLDMHEMTSVAAALATYRLLPGIAAFMNAAPLPCGSFSKNSKVG